MSVSGDPPGCCCCCCFLEPPSNTIFDNEYSKDGTMIRCGFKYCDCDHKYYPCTEETIKTLSAHVGLSVDRFVVTSAMNDNSLLFSTQPKAAPGLGTFPVKWPSEGQLKPSSIVCILELDDERCTLLEWLPVLLRSLYAGTSMCPYIFTRRFHSRRHLLYELLLGEFHKNLSSVHMPENRKLPILLVLSTHGPTEGQIFSTTPSKYSEKFNGYCEYCSLHDFVVTAQMALGDTLCGIYLSACYTGKLSKLHKDYPVEIKWLKNGTLKTDLVAPASEVYYSGSQTADAHMVTAFVESAADKDRDEFITSRPLRAIVHSMEDTMFPDLCNEMKLCYLNDADISFMVSDAGDNMRKRRRRKRGRGRRRIESGEENDSKSNEEDGMDSDDKETEFHPHRVVQSDLVVAYLPVNPRDYFIALSLSRNLSMRSDINVDTFVLSVDTAEVRLRTYAGSKRLLLVVLDVVSSTSFITTVKSREYLTTAKKLMDNSRYPYGVIFLCGSEEAAKRYKTFDSYPAAMMVTKSVRPSVWIPLTLYSVHLPVGENGPVITNLTAPSPSNATLAASDKWELEDVVKECKFVCSGMAQLASYQLLSTGSNPHYTLRLKQLPPIPPPLSATDRGKEAGSSKHGIQAKIVEQPLDIPTHSSSSSLSPLVIPTSAADAGVPEIIVIDDDDSNKGLDEFLPPSQKRAKIFCSKKPTRGRPKRVACKYSDEDLPLSANFRDVSVTHMTIKWDIDFARHVMYGEVVYRTKDLTKDGSREFVLDYSMLNIWEVHFMDTAPSKPAGSLVPAEFTTTPYSVTVLRPPGAERFPEYVVIRFSTTPEGLSVLWRNDAAENPCVFTGSCSLNNRSILPCQDAPEATTTYTAVITVPEKFRVVMSAPPCPEGLVSQYLDPHSRETFGDQQNRRKAVFFFHMGIPLPPSTISIAAGKFDEYVVQESEIPASIYAPPPLLAGAVDSFARPLVELVPAFVRYLGPYPFARADIVIMPADFLPLGLQSPNVTFLSQSMITSDKSMIRHFAHELAHNYFGLLISESDWYEMWLSEGFAEYASERVLLKCLGLSPREQEEHTRIASLLRYQSLLDDIRNTDDSEHILTSSASEDGVVKGGMRPVLGTIQYNLGYFILRHLALNVGVDRFDEFLARYVSHFRNKLLTGKDALDFFFTEFSDKASPGFSAADMELWLDSSNIRDNLGWKIRSLCSCSEDTNVFMAAIGRALALFYKASWCVSMNIQTPAEALCMEIASDMEKSWDTTMKLLFLAMASETDKVCPSAYVLINRYAHFTESNAEVRNAFCEIIVKYRFTKMYSHVERLLIEDQPMGLYVFSELLSAGKNERKLALSVYNKLEGRQDPQKHLTMLKLLRDYKVIK